MAVAIRLTRVGATKRPSYRVIAIDKRRSRDGRALEILGFYDPLTEPATVHLETEKIRAWIGKGAQPSDTVVKLLRQADTAAAGAATEKPKRATRSTAAKPSKKARAKATAAEVTLAEPPTEPAAVEPAEAAAEPAEAAAESVETVAAEAEAVPAEAEAPAETAPETDEPAEAAGETESVEATEAPEAEPSDEKADA